MPLRFAVFGSELLYGPQIQGDVSCLIARAGPFLTRHGAASAGELHGSRKVLAGLISTVVTRFEQQQQFGTELDLAGRPIPPSPTLAS
jgi:hypothetical protein